MEPIVRTWKYHEHAMLLWDKYMFRKVLSTRVELSKKAGF